MIIEIKMKLDIADDGSEPGELVKQEQTELKNEGLCGYVENAMMTGDIIEHTVSLNDVVICKNGEYIP